MNRLKLDWSLESAKERVDFIDIYIKQFDDLNEEEIASLEKYLLWGKDSNGIAVGAGTGLETKWTKPNETESLDAVLENLALTNSQLHSLDDAVVLKKKRDVFSRQEAREKASPFLVEVFEELWKTIDEAELTINFYELKTGKREKPPRNELMKRFTDEEIECIRARSYKLNQYQYLKLRHKLKDLRTEQFTFRDSYKPVFNITQSIYAPKDRFSVFDCDIEVLPLGLKEGVVGEIVFDINFDPRALDDEQLQIINRLIWSKKKVDKSKRKIFDFTDLETVYQLYLFREDLGDYIERIAYDHLVENNLDKLLKTLEFYESIADLTDIQLEILRLKEKKEKNTDIAYYINKKYGKSYTANYISTIFKQKIIAKINETAKLHCDTIENCFFPENFKVCNTCGRILLLDSRNWVKKARSKDGFQNRCKRCEHEMRKQKRGSQ